MPCTVSHDIAERRRAGQQGHRERNDCSFPDPVFISDTGRSLKGDSLPRTIAIASNKTITPPPTCIAPSDMPSNPKIGIPRNVATSNATVTLNPIVRAKRPLLRRSKPSVAARKTGIIETGPISTNSVMVFLMVKAKIESIIYRGWMKYCAPVRTRNEWFILLKTGAQRLT